MINAADIIVNKIVGLYDFLHFLLFTGVYFILELEKKTDVKSTTHCMHGLM